MMIYLIVFLIFMTMMILFQSILSILFASRKRIDNRLQSLDETVVSYDYREEEMTGTLAARLLGPMIESLGVFAVKLSPKSKSQRLEALLRRAGKIEKTSVGKWYFKKFIFAILLPGVMGIILFIFGTSMVNCVLIVLFSGFFIQFIINFSLKRTITGRQKEISKNLPDALDLVTVSVEAGLSFDGAIDRVIRQMPNALSKELSIALKEMRMGKTRREALRALSDRCEVENLTTLVGALIQADELGVGIGRVLRIQSQQIREKRREEAREKAMKAPVKIIFPLILFIFPTIFVVILGPAVIQMMEIFK